MKRKPTPKPSAFPLEDLFPGLHQRRPDIARKEAEDFLEFGGKPFDGFDLADKDTREQLLDVPPAKFIPFELKLSTDEKEMVNLREKMKDSPDAQRIDNIIANAMALKYNLPPHLCCIIDGGKVWVVVNDADDEP